MKKVSEIKFYILALNISPLEKSPRKKVSGDSPTILKLFSGSSIILYKNVPVKSPLENAWEQSMFTTIHKEKSPRNIKLGLYFW